MHHITLAEILSTNVTDFKLRSGLLPSGSTGSEASANAAARCADAVAALEGALSGTPPYLVGPRFSVADIIGGGVLGVAVRVGAIEPSRTTAAYLESLAARPAWQRASSKLDSRRPV